MSDDDQTIDPPAPPTEPVIIDEPAPPTTLDSMIAALPIPLGADARAHLLPIYSELIALSPEARELGVKTLAKHTGLTLTTIKASISELTAVIAADAAIGEMTRPEWMSALSRTAEGRLLSTTGNLITWLTSDPEWMGTLGYDRFRAEACWKRKPPWDSTDAAAAKYKDGQAITDQDATRLQAWFSRRGLLASYDTSHRAIDLVAERHPFHPVVDYLRALKWDGTARMGGDSPGIFVTYCGAEDTPYHRMCSRFAMLPHAARAILPGTKVDTMVILEGPQGQLKSTFIRKLVGDAWYTDTLSDFNSKDSFQELQGVWGVELPELDRLSRADANAAKSYISKLSDRYRSSYGRRVRDVPRQCVFWGTINPNGSTGYLKDQTGNRRFYPVRVSRIDLDALARDRDQLWAEAVHRLQHGEHWWPITDDERTLCQSEQDERREVDPWEDILRRLFASHTHPTVTNEYLYRALSLQYDRIHRGIETRLGIIMSTLGWTHPQITRDGRRLRAYLRPGCNVALLDPKEPLDPPEQSGPPSANQNTPEERAEMLVEAQTQARDIGRMVEVLSGASTLTVTSSSTSTTTLDYDSMSIDELLSRSLLAEAEEKERLKNDKNK